MSQEKKVCRAGSQRRGRGSGICSWNMEWPFLSGAGSLSPLKKKKKVARNEWVWLCPNIPYLWTLKFRIHIIFICHEIFDFFPTMKKNVKSHRKTGSDLLLVGLTGLQSKLHVCPSRLAPAGSSQSWSKKKMLQLGLPWELCFLTKLSCQLL